MSAPSSRPPPSVIFLNRFYWPEEPATAQLLTDLAEQLARRGADVTVITSHSGAAVIPARETHHGVRIRRVLGSRWARRGTLGKAGDFLTFQLGALVRLLFTVRSGETVVAMTDPPLLGIGAWLVARLAGARIVHWVQDIYPEIAIALTGHRWLAATRPLRDLAWRHADVCVTLGSDMAALLARQGVPPERIAVLPNWAPAGLSRQPWRGPNSLRASWGLADRFVVGYSGNLGRVHDLDPVLDVAEALRTEPGIVFVFIGGGAQRGRLEQRARARQLGQVQFRPAVARSELAEALAVPDLHLVTLLPGCEELVFPSKFYGVAAVGRGVVFIGPKDCGLARTIAEQRMGRAFTRDETAAIAAALRELSTHPAEVRRMADAAAEYSRPHLGATQAAEAWWRLLSAGDDNGERLRRDDAGA